MENRMPVSFVGKYPEHTRVLTGNTSFDMAVSGIDFKRNVLPGIPMRCGLHVWSKQTGIGKTHFVVSVAGKIARSMNKDIAVTPIDTFDIGNLEGILNFQGMETNCQIVLNPKGDAKSLDDLNSILAKKNVCVSILDSAYAAMSTAVDEGEVEDANMGRDAKMISTYVRQAKGVIDSAKEDKIFIVTNMSFASLGKRKGFGPIPYEPARGRTLMGMTSIHIELNDGWVSNKSMKFDKGRLLTGKVVKNNFGPTGREFYVFMIGGVGIHDGITAAFDCVKYGFATLKGSSSKTAKFEIGDESISLAEMVKNYENEYLFEPFLKALADPNNYDVICNNLDKPNKVFKATEVEDDEEVDEDEIDTDGQTPEELNNG